MVRSFSLSVCLLLLAACAVGGASRTDSTPTAPAAGAARASVSGPATAAADAGVGTVAAAAPVGVASIRLPAELRSGRFYLTATTAAGQPFTLFTDTGGGMFVTKAAAARLGLAVQGDEPPLAALPALRAPVANLPPRLPVFAAEGIPFEADGMLGAPWFASGGVWSFDYPRGELWWRPGGGDPARLPSGARAPLAFQADDKGQGPGFPRIQATIDGQVLDLLFDTGATVRLSPGALAALGDGGPAERAASFITASTLAAWRARHPDWRVIEGADANMPGGGARMIEVPQVTLAGEVVGPVWFAERPDKNFRQWMAQWMDKPIEGALGGNAFAPFRITADYKAGVAVFERAR